MTIRNAWPLFVWSSNVGRSVCVSMCVQIIVSVQCTQKYATSKPSGATWQLPGYVLSLDKAMSVDLHFTILQV